MKSGLRNSTAMKLAVSWAQQLNPVLGDLDEHIANIEASNLARHYSRTHVERLGSVNKIRPDGISRLLGGKMNSAALAETRIWKTRDLPSYVMPGIQSTGVCTLIGGGELGYVSLLGKFGFVVARLHS